MRKEGPNLPIEYPSFFGRESIGIGETWLKPTIEYTAIPALAI
jgi:hypothetical protein